MNRPKILFTVVWILYAIAGYHLLIWLYFLVGNLIWFDRTEIGFNSIELRIILVTLTLGALVQWYAQRLYGEPLLKGPFTPGNLLKRGMLAVLAIVAAAVIVPLVALLLLVFAWK